MKNKSFLVAGLAFLLVSGWYGQSVLSDMQSFNDWDKPKEVAALWRAGLFGLAAAACAAGLDLRTLLGPFGSFLPGGSSQNVVSDQKRAELNEKVGV